MWFIAHVLSGGLSRTCAFGGIRSACVPFVKYFLSLFSLSLSSDRFTHPSNAAFAIVLRTPPPLHHSSGIDTPIKGARSMDRHFLNAPPRENIPIIMGLLGCWNSSFMGYSSRALIPYAQALLRLPAHIQQLDMEVRTRIFRDMHPGRIADDSSCR
jgi:hypothetical protein